LLGFWRVLGYKSGVTNAPENLAKALEAMTHRVAELEAELAANSQLLNTYKAMLFGSRSEKARIVLDEQGCLDLGDLSDITSAPPAANDDQAPHVTKRKARRNIGALPKHLPRIIELIEPDSTQCACCQGARVPCTRSAKM